jgi:hypothetical protein
MASTGTCSVTTSPVRATLQRRAECTVRCAVEDNKDLESYNVKSRVDGFVKFAQWQASHTRGDNIMFTMGSDFNVGVPLAPAA